MPRPKDFTPSASRDRILAAATVEFAARGFAGAGIDRIARRARLNKAMIYYHFKSKQALYRAILRDMFLTVGTRLRAVGASERSSEDKVAEFLRTVLEEAERRPYFPSIMLREIAEGGVRLDPETLAQMSGVFQAATAIVVEGQQHGVFIDIHPLVAYFTMVAPIVFFLASAPVRREMRNLKLNTQIAVEPAAFVSGLHRFAMRGLRKD